MNLPQLPECPLFSRFWKEYPHKVGKQQAIKAWNKLAPNEDDLEIILKALRRQKQSKMWQEGIGIPHPSTYLNQARFMDEPIPEIKRLPTKHDSYMETLKQIFPENRNGTNRPIIDISPGRTIEGNGESIPEALLGFRESDAG